MPAKSFWRSAIGDPSVSATKDLYSPKWAISKRDGVATAGSCFAQHIGRNLKKLDFRVLDFEPPPLTLPPSAHADFGYSLYSARYGNIYTTRQLLQLAKEAVGERDPGEIVWAKGDAYFDALRPSVEPDGLSTRDAVLAHRKLHLDAVRAMLVTADVLVFTLGLTECWVHRESKTAFPSAPGNSAGAYDPDQYAFLNLTFHDVLSDWLAFRELVRTLRGGDDVRYLLTVSPVPLTATATGRHALEATTYSKSVLRAVAGQVAQTYDDTDYYPSYEIITNPWSTSDYFDANRRSVSAAGVLIAMKTFIEAHGYTLTDEHSAPYETTTLLKATVVDGASTDDTRVVCDEELLDAFGPKS